MSPEFSWVAVCLLGSRGSFKQGDVGARYARSRTALWVQACDVCENPASSSHALRPRGDQYPELQLVQYVGDVNGSEPGQMPTEFLGACTNLGGRRTRGHLDHGRA